MLNLLPAWLDRTHATIIASVVALPLGLVALHEGLHYTRATPPPVPAELAQSALKRAELACFQGFPALAQSEANYALSLDAELAPAWCQRGMAFSRQGLSAAAMNDFNRTLELDPTNKTAYIERGLLRHRSGDEDGASSDMEAAMKLGWENALAFQNRGIIRLETGHLLDAAEDATAAMKIDRFLPGAYALRAEAYLEAGQHVDASRDFVEWEHLEPANVEAQAWHAEVWRRDGDPRGAIRDCDKVLDQAPTCALAWCFRGWARLDLGDRAFAISDFETALRFDKKCARAHAGLGKALAEENLSLAVTHLNRALEIHAGLLDARLRRGISQEKLGNREAAIADLRAVLEMAPPCWPGRSTAEETLKRLN